MTTVTKTIKFDAAHLLANHPGLCRNLHGHTYRVDLSVARRDDDGDDMVIDFKDLKQIANEVISARFDHAFICDGSARIDAALAETLERSGLRVVRMAARPTAENMARMFYREIKARIPDLSSVRVWETADSSAEYRE